MVVTAFAGAVFAISLVNLVLREDGVVRGLFAVAVANLFIGVFWLMNYETIGPGAQTAKVEQAAPKSERLLPPESSLEAAFSDLLIADYRRALLKEAERAVGRE